MIYIAGFLVIIGTNLIKFCQVNFSHQMTKNTIFIVHFKGRMDPKKVRFVRFGFGIYW